VVICYLSLTAIYAWPVLRALGTTLPSDLGDPALNTWILWWDAHAVPLTAKWWNAPMFYPSLGAFGLSETMLSVATITSPLQWMGLTAVQAYNIAFILSFPAAAMAAHALAYRLTRRHDAALIAGLSFGFAPYRVAQWPHLQMLWSCWMPLGLFALHRYVAKERTRDLVLFALAWFLASLTCGYYLMYFSVLVGLWMCWFARTRRAWISVGVATVVAALPLAPLLFGYQRIQAGFGLSRGMAEIESFGADLTAMWATAPHLMFASHWTLAPKPEGELYPGATVLLLALAGAIIAWRRLQAPQTFARTRRVLLGLALATAALGLYTAVKGGWAIGSGLLQFSSHRPYRIVSLALYFAAAFALIDGRVLAAWKRRSPFLFYVAASVAMLLFALGPVGRVFGERFLWKAPYSWLMMLPGGAALRVPARFAMLFVLCLGQAAAMGWTRLVTSAKLKPLAIVAALAVLADGWAILVARPLPPPTDVAALDPQAVLLELPMTDLYSDTRALLNATMHGRTLVNGFSGYSPPDYAPLVAAAQMMDAHLFDVLRENRPLGIYIDPDRDEDGKVRKFVEAQPGVTRLPSSTGPLFVFPALKAAASGLELRPLPIASITASTDSYDVGKMTDGDPHTRWGTQRGQSPGDSLSIDFGGTAELGRVVLEQGPFAGDYPRALRVEVSADGSAWTIVWEGPTASLLMMSAVRDPIRMPLVIDLSAPVRTRYVRLTCLSAREVEWWSVSELKAYGR
jgi:hypothetical protein